MKNMRRKILFNITAIVLCIFQIMNCKLVYGYEYSKINNLSNIQNENMEEVRLQDDFYYAVNKDWLSNAKLSEGYVSYGTFEELCGKVNGNINSIILDIEKNKKIYDKNSEEIKVLNLYNNYLDIKVRNKTGIQPIKKYMKQIDDIKNIDDFKNILYDEEFSYFQSLINLGVGADYKDSTNNVLYIGRSNIGLGNSLYYKNNNEKSNKIKKAYIDYLTKLNILYGENKKSAKINAEAFYDVEEKIAKNRPTNEEEAMDSKRIEKCYNIYAIDELKELAPNIDFLCLLSKLKVDNANKIIVEDPKEVQLVNSFIVEDNLDNMKKFFKTSVLMNTDNCLTSKFRKASDELKKLLYGVEATDLNNSSGIKFINNQLGEVVSKLYVNKYFDKECKDDVEAMANEIISNFENRLNNISWMSESTKEEALNKLQNINIKIGYPDEWNDYSDIKLRSYEDGGSLVENIINIYVAQSRKQFCKINKPVNKKEWNMGACAVNAYYNPLNNEIVFPAGILQAPFYNKNATKERNLGGIGAVIGHELTHAFDNVGAQFDETGKLKNWWTEEDYKEFTNKSKKVIDYYSKIQVENGKFINGYLTAGENISDLGGIACVLDIAKKLENPNLKDLFENYAVIWREVSTKELKEYLLNNDCHAPKKARVNNVLSQFEDFYKTYDIKEGDKMYVEPEKRISIW